MYGAVEYRFLQRPIGMSPSASEIERTFVDSYLVQNSMDYTLVCGGT